MRIAAKSKGFARVRAEVKYLDHKANATFVYKLKRATTMSMNDFMFRYR
jgi:hypothetical protein